MVCNLLLAKDVSSNFRIMENLNYLSEEELSDLKGGFAVYSSSQVASVEMGNSSCCNVTIEIGKNT